MVLKRIFLMLFIVVAGNAMDAQDEPEKDNLVTRLWKSCTGSCRPAGGRTYDRGKRAIRNNDFRSMRVLTQGSLRKRRHTRRMRAGDKSTLEKLLAVSERKAEAAQVSESRGPLCNRSLIRLLYGTTLSTIGIGAAVGTALQMAGTGDASPLVLGFQGLSSSALLWIGLEKMYEGATNQPAKERTANALAVYGTLGSTYWTQQGAIGGAGPDPLEALEGPPSGDDELV